MAPKISSLAKSRRAVRFGERYMGLLFKRISRSLGTTHERRLADLYARSQIWQQLAASINIWDNSPDSDEKARIVVLAAARIRAFYLKSRKLHEPQAD